MQAEREGGGVEAAWGWVDGMTAAAAITLCSGQRLPLSGLSDETDRDVIRRLI